MSDLHRTTPEVPLLSLVLHTAIDYVHGHRVGIGIIHRAPTGAARNNIIPTTRRKYSVKVSPFTAENVNIQKRAHIFAIILAMGLARGAIKRRCITVQRVTVLWESAAVVEAVNFNRENGPGSLKEVVSMNDRAIVERVLMSVRELSRWGFDDFVAEVGVDGMGEEDVKAEREDSVS